MKRRTTMLPTVGALALAASLSGCGGGDMTRAAMAQEASGPDAGVQGQAAPTLPAGEFAAVNELSAAFRAASGTAMPAVVFIGVEREAPAAQGRPGRFGEAPRGFGPPDGNSPPPQIGSGSGFIIDPAGRIITNHHVIEGATRISVRLHDGREFDAEVVGRDASTDIAVLQIDADGDHLPVVRWGDSDRLQVGDWVLALGSPLGLDFTVTSGIVSARGRQLNTGGAALESYIQTDAAINPGNSGGPLVDLAGNVIGINSAIYGGQRFVGYGFAVPSSLAQRVIRDLLEYGFVRRPRLGVRVSDVTAVDAEAFGLDEVRGADVNSVEEGSPAANAGVRVGDVVVAVDDHPIENSNGLITALAQMDPGERTVLSIVRGGDALELEVRLGEFDRDAPVNAAGPVGSSVPDVVGFAVQPLTPEIAGRFGLDRDGGVVVSEVRQYSGAARAGVRPGQILVGLGSQSIETLADYRRLSEGVSAGEVMSLRLIDPDLGETIINFRTDQK